MLQHGCFAGITIRRTDFIFIRAVTSMCFIVVREAKNHLEPGRTDSIKIVLNKLQKCGIYSCCFETLQHVCAVYKGTMKVRNHESYRWHSLPAAVHFGISPGHP